MILLGGNAKPPVGLTISVAAIWLAAIALADSPVEPPSPGGMDCEATLALPTLVELHGEDFISYGPDRLGELLIGKRCPHDVLVWFFEQRGWRVIQDIRHARRDLRDLGPTDRILQLGLPTPFPKRLIAAPLRYMIVFVTMRDVVVHIDSYRPE